MAIIDNRLKDCDTDQDVTENFNRVLNVIDNVPSGGGAVYVEPTENEGEIDLTPKQLDDYIEEGKFAILLVEDDGVKDFAYIIQASKDGDDNLLTLMNFNTNKPIFLVAETEDTKYHVEGD